MHEFIARSGGRSDASVDLFRELFEPRGGFLTLGGLLQPLGQLVDLDTHVPDQLVDPIGLDDGAVDDVLLAAKYLGLLARVFGQRIERGEFVLGGHHLSPRAARRGPPRARDLGVRANSGLILPDHR